MNGVGDMATREEQRDEVQAVLATTRELPPDMDEELADALLDRLNSGSMSDTNSVHRSSKNRIRNPYAVASVWSALFCLVLSTGMIDAVRTTPTGLFFDSGRLPSLYWISLVLIAATFITCFRLARRIPSRSPVKHLAL
jgi:hypothetical protein